MLSKMIQRFKDLWLRARRKAGIFKSSMILTARQIFFGVKIAAVYPLKRKSQKRVFFILCQYRTGSNLFISYLNSIPGALFDYEILSRWHGYGLRRWGIARKDVYRHVSHSLHYQNEEIRGAKIFFQDLWQLKVPLNEFLKEFSEARWFVLYRKNILTEYLSHFLACKTKQWLRYEGDHSKAHAQIRFYPEKFLIYRNQIKSWYEEAMKAESLRGKSLWISYEELAANPQKFFDERVFPFLGLPPSRIHTRLARQNLREPSEVISNYAEVRETIEKMDFTQNYET